MLAYDPIMRGAWVRPSIRLTAALWLAAGLLPTAQPAMAGRTDQTFDGQIYQSHCTEDGLVLTAEAPGGEILYLGKSCDARSTGEANGSWGWANGGIFVELPDRQIGFPMQEVFCPAGGAMPFDAIPQCSR